MWELALRVHQLLLLRPRPRLEVHGLTRAPLQEEPLVREYLLLVVAELHRLLRPQRQVVLLVRVRRGGCLRVLPLVDLQRFHWLLLRRFGARGQQGASRYRIRR